MLNFEEFQQYVLDHIRDELPEELKNAHVDLNEVNKNNGKVLTAILVRAEGNSVAPTIYLDGFYKSYEDGAELGDIIKDVADTAAKHQDEEFGNLAHDFQNFEFVKDKIVMSLVNADKNEQMLKDTPHTMKEDLAVIYKVVLDTDEAKGGMATITIKDAHMQAWGVEVEQLHSLAMENSNRMIPATLRSMNDVIREMMSKDGMTDDLLEIMVQDMPVDQQMYVISNTQSLNGAASIIYSDVLQQLAEKLGTDLYVLPSSVHETIAVSQNMGDPQMLAEMVQEVNEGQVSLEEQLSDHVYSYNASTQELSLADTTMEQLELSRVSENNQSYEAPSQEANRPKHHR